MAAMPTRPPDRVLEMLGLVEDEGLWYCATRYVPGLAGASESPAQQRRRGEDMARLHVAQLRVASHRGGSARTYRCSFSAEIVR